MKNLLIAFLLPLTLVACKGGGGGYTHAELASDFVYRLNFALGYDVDLEKTYTLQSGYIVVYDYDFDTYDAYYIGGYNPSGSINDYVNDYFGDFYFDLDYIGNNTYEDFWSGTLFNEGAAIDRNMLRKKGQGQQDYMAGMASQLVQSYNMSEQAAKKVANGVLVIQAMNARRLAGDKVTNQAYAQVLQNLIGTSNIDDMTAAFTGNVQKKNDLVKNASQALQMSPADTNALLEKMKETSGL